MPDDIKFHCCHCGQSIEAPEAMQGSEIDCPNCGKSISVMGNVTEEELAKLKEWAKADKAANKQPKEKRPFITTTGNEVIGWEIESYVGVVRGIVVRSPDLLQGMFGGLKTIVGGNIESYAKVCEHARREAFDRMLGEAYRLQADAIIAFRYDATEFSQGVTEVLAYGTAVRLVAKTAGAKTYS